MASHNTRALHFLPIHLGRTGDGGSRVPMFWGYALPPHLAPRVSHLLQKSQLALVLDLDETLLFACSMEELRRRLEVSQQAQ